MGRSSREQAERNRERVVQTASRLFRQHGVENVSIADVMAAAELTPGGFYKQFASKEALVAEAFALAFEQSAGSWQQVRKREHTTAPSGLAALVQHYFRRRAPEVNCPIIAFASQAAHLPSDAPTTDIYSSGVEALFHQFREEAIRDAGLAGQPAPSEADIMVIFAAMVGTGMLTRAAGDTDWTRSLQSAVMEALPQAASDKQ